MAQLLTLNAEITNDGRLRVDLPPNAPRGQIVLTLAPAPVASSKPPSQDPIAPPSPLRSVDSETARRSFDAMLDELGICGEAIPAHELREMSRQTRLEPGELSRDLITAREE